MAKVFRIVMVMLLIQAQLESSYAFTYTVQSGDTLSHHVAGRWIAGPVWGPDGSFIKILALNPKLKKPYLLTPGESIELGNLVGAPVATAATPAAPEIKEVPATARTVAETTPPPELPSDGSSTALELTPFLAMTSLTSTDLVSGAQATVSSNFYGGASVKFSQLFNDHFLTFVRAKLAYLSFEAPTRSAASLSASPRFLGNFGLGVEQKIGPKFSLGLDADLARELFVRGASTNTVTVDAVTIPAVGLQASYAILERNAFGVKLSGIFEEKFGATTDDYQVKTGNRFGGFVAAQKRNQGHEQYEFSLGAFRRKQDTSVTLQSETTYEASFRFFLGDGE